MLIRKYQPNDLGPVVEMIQRSGRHITREEFDRGLDEPGERIRDHTFLAELSGVVVGYINLCFVESSTNVQVFCYGCVDPTYRRQGIGTKLYRFILSHLKSSVIEEVRPVTFHQMVRESSLGHRQLLERLGIQPSTELHLMVYTGHPHPHSHPLLPNDFRFREARLDEAAAYAEIYRQAFAWRSVPTEMTPESISYELSEPNYPLELYPVLVDQQNTPVGYGHCQIRGDGTSGGTTGHISTVAIHPRVQGLGLGKALVQECLQRLLSTGVATVKLSVESDNPTPAGLIYHKIGFTTVDRFFKYSSPMNGELGTYPTSL